jgi:hypothetical protein
MDVNNIIFADKDAKYVTNFIDNIVHNINYSCNMDDIIFTDKDAQYVTNFIDNIVHNINISDTGYITPRDQPTDKEMPKAPRKTYSRYYTINTV